MRLGSGAVPERAEVVEGCAPLTQLIQVSVLQNQAGSDRAVRETVGLVITVL